MSIYEEIEARRVKQRGAPIERRTDTEEWVALVVKYASRCAFDPSRSVFREAMLKAAVVCVAAIEAHDAEGEVRG